MITVIGNLKGGCGKSTVTFNLALWLLHAGREAVAFDLDPQATLSDVAEVRAEEELAPELQVYRPERDPTQVMRDHPGEVLVDVGASNMWAMRQAIGMADRILVPVPPSQADVWSTQRFLNLVQETAAGSDKVPELLMFVNRADTHPGLRESEETQQALLTLPGVTVLEDVRLGQRTAFRRSFSEGQAVFELSPSSKASKEFLALARAIYPDVASKMKRKGKKK